MTNKGPKLWLCAVFFVSSQEVVRFHRFSVNVLCVYTEFVPKPLCTPKNTWFKQNLWRRIQFGKENIFKRSWLTVVAVHSNAVFLFFFSVDFMVGNSSVRKPFMSFLV